MPTKLWPEVLQYIVDIDNMSATRALNGKTPYEKLHDKKPDVSKVKAKDVKFREDITVGKKYLEALLVGRHGTYNYIPRQTTRQAATPRVRKTEMHQRPKLKLLYKVKLKLLYMVNQKFLRLYKYK
eukprot:jgi/Phyca11/20872/fgenesh1_pg.PHYCAscaffold_75_\